MFFLSVNWKVNQKKEIASIERGGNGEDAGGTIEVTNYIEGLITEFEYP